MDELILDNNLKDNLIDYLISRKPPHNTFKTYRATINRIFADNTKLNRDVINRLCKKFKHQNQRAVLVLINRYCYDYNIDFKMYVPKISGAGKTKLIKTLPQSEIDIMIKVASPPYNLALKCILKIGGGLRISECIRLSWSNFGWVEWLEEKEEGIVNILHSKGGSRTVTVPKLLMHDLYNYAITEEIINELDIPIGSQIFPFDDNWNEELRESNLPKWKDMYLKHAYDWFRYHILEKECEKALGHKINIHSLRHSRAMELYEVYNKPIEIIQKLLGHKEISTTMIYAQVSTKKVIESMKGVK